jgi:hypothetical protein
MRTLPRTPVILLARRPGRCPPAPDADAVTETNAEVIARIARDGEPVDLTMDDILAAREVDEVLRQRLSAPRTLHAPAIPPGPTTPGCGNCGTTSPPGLRVSPPGRR